MEWDKNDWIGSFLEIEFNDIILAVALIIEIEIEIVTSKYISNIVIVNYFYFWQFLPLRKSPECTEYIFFNLIFQTIYWLNQKNLLNTCFL